MDRTVVATSKVPVIVAEAVRCVAENPTDLVYFAKAKGEVEKAVRTRNSSGDDGGKYLAAAVGEQAGKPLTSVCRDRDTADGGNTGQMTSNPMDVDAIVKRAWPKIHS